MINDKQFLLSILLLSLLLFYLLIRFICRIVVRYDDLLKSKDNEDRARKSREYSMESRDEDSITPLEQFFQVIKMDVYLLKACLVNSEMIGFYLYTK